MSKTPTPPRSSFAIAGREIGEGHAPYVIAEVSGNHNKDLGRALKMIDVAKDCGADAVKFQTYTADSLTLPSDRPEFQITSGTWAGWNLHKLYQEAATPYEWFPALFAHGEKLGITVFSSPFDNDAVDLLENLNASAYKIASNEFTDWPLIRRTAQTGRPIILSTGTASLDEIDDTVAFLEAEGVRDFALLHCVSAYPAPIDSAHMRNVTALRERFPVPIGFSDHTLDITAPIVATALGAAIIEKHFVLDRADGGPDSSFAIEPDELKRLCQTVRDAHAATGGPQFGMKDAETKSPIYRRHFYAIRDITQGEEIGPDNVKAIRARQGIAAREFEKLFGSKASHDIPAHEPVTWEAVHAR
jgi:pseudaminic acid synthase